MYKVILLNDDFTPMEFVVHILERFFKIGREKAIEIMLDVHQKGLAVVMHIQMKWLVKVSQVMDHARKNQHPCNALWKE